MGDMNSFHLVNPLTLQIPHLVDLHEASPWIYETLVAQQVCCHCCHLSQLYLPASKLCLKFEIVCTESTFSSLGKVRE